MPINKRRPGDLINYADWSKTVIETSPDPILEKAKRDHPITQEEIEAAAAVEVAEKKFNAFLLEQRRTLRDLGEFEGVTTGWLSMDDRLRGFYEAVRSDLERALVKRNELIRARHVRVQAQVDQVNAKLAAEAQRDYQRRHGQ